MLSFSVALLWKYRHTKLLTTSSCSLPCFDVKLVVWLSSCFQSIPLFFWTGQSIPLFFQVISENPFYSVKFTKTMLYLCFIGNWLVLAGSKFQLFLSFVTSAICKLSFAIAIKQKNSHQKWILHDCRLLSYLYVYTSLLKIQSQLDLSD